jgi:hypothetical protein
MIRPARSSALFIAFSLLAWGRNRQRRLLVDRLA